MIALLGLLFAALFSNSAYAGVLHGSSEVLEEYALLVEMPPESSLPQFQASDLEDTMTGASQSGSSLYLSWAISSLERGLLNECSEPLVLSLFIEFPVPFPMELLKIPILTHFSA